MPASKPEPLPRVCPKICLFGGTFDPIHAAHIAIAVEAVRRFALDRMLLVPAHTPPHKAGNGLAPYEDRFRMVELACRDHPELEASRLEEGEGRSYTVDTVKRFLEMTGADCELFFLIGADAFDEIESWKDWRTLARLVRFIVVTRPGGEYNVPPGARVLTLEGLELPVSSSLVRELLAHGQPAPDLPPPVQNYILLHGLYKR